jgi:CheY-like chemotaxis protein
VVLKTTPEQEALIVTTPAIAPRMAGTGARPVYVVILTQKHAVLRSRQPTCFRRSWVADGGKREPGARSLDVSSFKIVLADDHATMRRLFKMILSEHRELEVVGEACDGLALVKLVEELPLQPDLVIVDVTMPTLQGIEAAQHIKQHFPGIKILVCTVHREKEYVSRAFGAGVEGYLLKDEADTSLFTAIQAIRGGKTYKSSLLDIWAN